MDQLLTTGEAARALGLKPNSLARWASDGEIQPAAITPGGHYRWDLDDLRAQMREMMRRRRET